MEQVRAILARDSARWTDFRRDLHRNPEPSGADVETARKVATELRRLGFEVRTNVGGHGVSGILRGARPGPRPAVRWCVRGWTAVGEPAAMPAIIVERLRVR